MFQCGAITPTSWPKSKPPEYSVRNLMRKMNVKVCCTTNDMELLGRIVEDICFNNAAEFFDIDAG